MTNPSLDRSGTMVVVGSRRRLRVVLAAAVLAVVAILGVFSVTRPADPVARQRQGSLARTQPGSPDATVTLEAPGARVPPSFVGVSADPPEVRDYLRASPAFGRAVSLLRVRDGSPMLLRVGGKSADFLYWKYRGRHDPRFVVHAGSRWLAGLARLTRANGFRVSLGLNLAAHAPRMAVGFAKAVKRGLPRGALVELSIGNEPDVYERHPMLEAERVPSTLPRTPRHWTRGYSMARYRRDFLAYASALRSAGLGLPLAGPETAHVPWRDALAPLGPSGPKHLAIHRYALTACPGPHSPLYPTIARLLDEQSSTGLAEGLPEMAGPGHAAGRTVRLSEFAQNSCPGDHGVSDSFATALWAPDALFSLVAAGVDGVNFQLRTAQRNSALAVRGRAVIARPALYGIALFARTTGPGARLVRVSTVAAAGLRLKAWAVRSSDKLRVLLINKGPRAASVRVRDPGTSAAAASVVRLTAPSIRATTGTRLGGQSIASSGRLVGRPATSTTPRDGDAYRVAVPGYSAALVTLPR